MAQPVTIKCFDCNNEMSFEAGISRRDECSQCGADVRCCRNCRFYEPTAYNQCHENQADPIQEKNRSNFCDYFEPGSSEGGNKSREDQLAAAEALFKK